MFTALLRSLYKTLSDVSLPLDAAPEQGCFLYLRNTKNFVTNQGFLICHLRLDRRHLDYIEIAIVHTLIHVQIHVSLHSASCLQRFLDTVNMIPVDRLVNCPFPVLFSGMQCGMLIQHTVTGQINSQNYL